MTDGYDETRSVWNTPTQWETEKWLTSSDNSLKILVRYGRIFISNRRANLFFLHHVYVGISIRLFLTYNKFRFYRQATTGICLLLSHDSRGWTTEKSWLDSQQGQDTFLPYHSSRLALRGHPASNFNGYLAPHKKLKWVEAEADHSHLLFKTEWIYTSIPSIHLHRMRRNAFVVQVLKFLQSYCWEFRSSWAWRCVNALPIHAASNSRQTRTSAIHFKRLQVNTHFLYEAGYKSLQKPVNSTALFL
jgi:hypothetical protein